MSRPVTTNLPLASKIQQSDTDVLESVGVREEIGPPAIDLIWWNKTPTPYFKGSRGPCYLKINDLVANIAALFKIEGGDLRLVTVTASTYHAFVLCESSKLTLTMDDVWEFSCGRIGRLGSDSAEGLRLGVKPSINAIWHNMNITSDFRTVEKVITSFPEMLYIKVGEHVRTGLYNVISLNVSSTSLIVVCETKCSLERFLEMLNDI